ncbi:MAG: leucine-rich repeat domain-containing protein [Clostridia bacterium]|nr:leucine-rich repeat domain-containing protein [Clostridia bacterium]
MKKWFLGLLSGLCVATCALGFAACNDSGGDGEGGGFSKGLEYTLSADQNSYIVTGIGTCEDTELIIPATHKGKPVTAIGDNAFEICDYLTEIVIPDSVTSIGNYAFWYCVVLNEIVIPDSVTSIGGGAFASCWHLNEIVIPDSVTSIGGGAFHDCERLIIYCEVANQPSGWYNEWNGCWNDGAGPVVWNCKNNDVADDGYIYSVIGGLRYALKDGEAMVTKQYKYSTSITSVTIPISVAYKNCVYAVTGIGSFYGYFGLTEIVIPESVTRIDDAAFARCEGLTIYCEAASRPDGWALEWEGDNPVVWDCKNNDVADDGYIYSVIGGLRYVLNKDGKAAVAEQAVFITEATIPASVTYKGFVYTVTGILENAFAGYSMLTEIVIPDSVTYIGYRAFAQCIGLKEIIIPDPYIGEYAFDGCDSLIIYCEAASDPCKYNDWNPDNRPVYWYSETQPTTEGDYWRYVDGVPTKW